MEEVSRISAAETHDKVNSGRAMLVCAYADAERCKKLHIEGSIPFQEFESRTPTLSKTQEIIFYCD